ncbi:hypothetical protein ACCB39_12145 [Staphylococcus aureus]|uniref:hypothetical protein n=1 Tax=Staphylococcus aureus TaxID=1280 RepID=UPI000768B56F|nr:hypothetical protein DPF86_13450 [Staphylococcus argenteus]CXJ85505.1 Uncharacterised protein [Staphylococcus aureus]
MNIHSHLKTFIHNKLLYYQCQTIKGVQLFKTLLLCGKNTPFMWQKHSFYVAKTLLLCGKNTPFMWQKHSFYVAKTLLLCGKNTPLGIEIPCCSRAEQAPKKVFKKIYKNILKSSRGATYFSS